MHLDGSSEYTCEESYCSQQTIIMSYNSATGDDIGVISVDDCIFTGVGGVVDPDVVNDPDVVKVVDDDSELVDARAVDDDPDVVADPDVVGYVALV